MSMIITECNFIRDTFYTRLHAVWQVRSLTEPRFGPVGPNCPVVPFLKIGLTAPQLGEDQDDQNDSCCFGF